MYTHELKIYQDTQQLLILLARVQKQLNRTYKGNLGTKMLDCAVDLFTCLSRANREQGKRREYALEQFLINFETIKTLIRALEELKEISIKQSVQIALLTDRIGKLANGWKSKC